MSGLPVAAANPEPLPERIPHPPIVIRGAAGVTVGNGIRGGTGTALDPFLVQGWEIDLNPIAPTTPIVSAFVIRDAISIQDTSAFILVSENVIRGAPGNSIFVRNSPNVRIERNVIDIDNAGLAPDFEATGARPVGILAEVGALSVRENTVTVQDAGHAGAVGIWVVGSSAVVSGNTVRNVADGILFFEGILLDTASGAVAAGNTVSHEGAGATVYAAYRARNGRPILRDNLAGGTGTAAQSVGLELVNTYFAVVERNDLRVGFLGLYAGGGGSNTLRDNVVRGGTLGMIVQSERSDTILRNNVTGATYGFGLMGSVDDHFLHTIPAGNKVNERPVLVLSGLRDTTVDASAYGTLGFLGVVNADNVTVQNVNIQGSVQGLLLGDFDKGLAENIVVAGNWRGVDLSASYSSRVTNTRGVSAAVHGSAASRIDNSTFTGGPERGTGTYGRAVGPYAIWLASATQHLTLDHVTVTGAGCAIYAQRTTFLEVRASVLRANGYGAFFEFTSGDMLRGNVIEGNTRPVGGAGARVDAAQNWWGSAAGPVGVDTRQISVAPWLTSAPAGAGDP